jgi:hypothetical protein
MNLRNRLARLEARVRAAEGSRPARAGEIDWTWIDVLPQDTRRAWREALLKEAADASRPGDLSLQERWQALELAPEVRRQIEETYGVMARLPADVQRQLLGAVDTARMAVRPLPVRSGEGGSGGEPLRPDRDFWHPGIGVEVLDLPPQARQAVEEVIRRVRGAGDGRSDSSGH